MQYGIKINLVIFGFLVVVIIGQSFYFNHKLNKQRKFVEKGMETLKDSIAAKEFKEVQIIYQGIDNTATAKDNKNNIDSKLKKDETDIDNSDVTNDDIEKYISKYKQQ